MNPLFRRHSRSVLPRRTAGPVITRLEQHCSFVEVQAIEDEAFDDDNGAIAETTPVAAGCSLAAPRAQIANVPDPMRSSSRTTSTDHQMPKCPVSDPVRESA